MSWVLVLIAVMWLVVAIVVALAIGRGVWLADREAAAALARRTNWVDSAGIPASAERPAPPVPGHLPPSAAEPAAGHRPETAEDVQRSLPVPRPPDMTGPPARETAPAPRERGAA
jgi:hypothetical protein